MHRLLLVLVLFFVGNLAAQSSDSFLHKRERFRQYFKSLNLTAEQETKLKEIYRIRKETFKKRAEENKVFRENVKKKTEAEIKLILSPDQQQKYESLLQERKKSRKRLIEGY